jgi:2,4-dienoyl-CoA reductase-like NADH-dependent reductase (Old Yellow Enzyme family)
MITTPQQANDLVAEGKADLVLLAREFLRDPHFVLRAANELGVAVKPAVQDERAWQGVLHQEKPHVLSDGILEVNYQKRK